MTSSGDGGGAPEDGGGRVLVVDDSGYAVRPLIDILRSDGHEVAWASDGPSGLRLAAEMVPDLVLLDVMMPGMDGYEVLRRLRRDPALGQVPVLLLTALDDRESRLRGFEAGADDFLSKPTDRDELRARVRTVLGLGRFRRLLRERHKVETIVDAAPDGLCVVVPDGRIVSANPALARLLGAEHPAALLGLPLAEALPVASGRLEALLAGPAADLRPAAWEGSVERQDGTGATVEVSATAVAWDMGPAVLFVVRDITERRRLEAALRRSQRLDAMARLAGGLAHDFRNYLGTLRTTALLLRDQLPAQGTPREDADLIVALADQASGMVSQLLAFAQRQELAPTRLDLNPLVRSWQPVLQHLLGRAGTLRVTLADRELWTLADPIQLQQVVTNLVANARDALGAGGRVTLTTGTVEAGGREWVRLSVTDDGAGMPPDVLERIFEPFYSTKASGTGLGLAMVHGIVQQLGGCVEVESAAGQGTTVHVDLPVAPPATDGG